MESSAHRRERRKRTRSRTRLRLLLDGIQTAQTEVIEADCQRLEAHHSGSTLPSQVRIAMCSGQGPAWWCGYCRKHVKYLSSFCPSCGVHWQEMTGQWYSQPSYPTFSHHRTPSPRSRQAPWSPRRRGAQQQVQQGKKGDGQGKGDDKSSGKGKPSENRCHRFASSLSSIRLAPLRCPRLLPVPNRHLWRRKSYLAP